MKTRICIIGALALLLVACPEDEDKANEANDPDAGEDSGDAGSDVGVDVDPDVPIEDLPGEELEVEISAGFSERQAQYLEYCTAENGPDGSGSIYGQNCRVFSGETTYDDEQIQRAVDHMNERRDTADFRANGMVRLLYLDDETGALGDERRALVDETLFNFKYWLDEPGQDGMAYWTENHQILFHTAELLMGQRYPDTEFPNSGMTGQEHVEHALPRIERWLTLRGHYGFSEWHSNVYYNEDIPALLNLVDFAEDETIRELATMVLDVIAIDLAHNSFQGVLATTHGRTYESKFIGGLNDSTAEFAWMVLGTGEYRSAGNFGGTFLATSTYEPPALLEDLAEAIADNHEVRHRDSFNISEGPEIGIPYGGLDNVVVWAGMAGIVAPDTIDGSMEVMEEYDLWSGFLFGDLPDEFIDLLRQLMGTPGLRNMAEQLADLGQGMALEAVDTYIYRTPFYQLGGAQSYKPGMWSAQTRMWTGAISPQAFVTTSAPALVGAGIGEQDVTVDEAWIGGWHPRATFHQNVGVISYRELERDPLVATFVNDLGYLHAYFPQNEFDEVIEDTGWYIGRLGDAYIGLWSELACVWSEENDFEIVCDGNEGVYIVELGSAEEHGTFEDFANGLIGSSVAVSADRTVTYDSPSIGSVVVGWEGEMTVAGDAVDIGPYERWDHETTRQTRHEPLLEVELDGMLLQYDFDAATRRLFALD